jgi:isopropylmalate/homocitrate/citramalate synthase
MKKDKKMTLDEHMETADDLAIATHHLSKIFFRCQGHYPATHRLMKLLYKILPDVLSGIFIQVKSELDEEYHRVINDEQFRQFGHIYYNLDERYKKLKENSERIDG